MGRKKGLNMCDILMILLGFCGGIMGCVACLFGYYRWHEADTPDLQWPMRKYYIKKLTDKAMQPTVTWKTLKQDVCAKFQAAQMKFGNPVGMATAKLMERTIQIPICGIKPMCRTAMSERCIFYDYAVDDGIVVILGNIGAMLLLALSGFCLMISNKPHWKMYAGICVSLGGIGIMCTVGYWAYDTDKYLKRIGKAAVYPYPPLKGWGFFMNAGGAGLMLTAGVCGFISSLSAGKSNAGGGADPLMAGPMGGQPMCM